MVVSCVRGFSGRGGLGYEWGPIGALGGASMVQIM